MPWRLLQTILSVRLSPLSRIHLWDRRRLLSMRPRALMLMVPSRIPRDISGTLAMAPKTMELQMVQFDGSGSRDPDGFVVFWHWTFGDNSTFESNNSFATHVYSTPGVYNVTLTVLDNGNSTVSVAHFIQVSMGAVIASISFTPLNTGVVGLHLSNTILLDSSQHTIPSTAQSGSVFVSLPDEPPVASFTFTPTTRLSGLVFSSMGPAVLTLTVSSSSLSGILETALRCMVPRRSIILTLHPESTMLR